MKLERAMGTKGKIRSFQNHRDRPSLKFKQRFGDPVQLTEVLEARDSVHIVSQNGKLKREASGGNFVNTMPVFLDGFFPHGIARRRADMGT